MLEGLSAGYSAGGRLDAGGSPAVGVAGPSCFECSFVICPCVCSKAGVVVPKAEPKVLGFLKGGNASFPNLAMAP